MCLQFGILVLQVQLVEEFGWEVWMPISEPGSESREFEQAALVELRSEHLSGPTVTTKVQQPSIDVPISST